MVHHGDRFGPSGRHVYQSYRPSVELGRVRALPGSSYLNCFNGDMLGAFLAPYPVLPITSDGAVRIPPDEVRRLVEWADDQTALRVSLPARTVVAAAEGRGEAIAAELRDERLDVAVAHDGDEALRLAAEQAPALVIAEATLPRIDGFQLARELRRADATARVVYLLVGAYADDEFAFAAGANVCLPWPLDADGLRSTAAELLGLA